VWKPDWARYERVIEDSWYNNKWIKPCTKHFPCRYSSLLHVRREFSLKQFSEHKLKTKAHALGAENWWLTPQDLLHQYFEGGASKNADKSVKLLECKQCTILIGSGKTFTLSLIGYTSTCETAVLCHSDWLWRFFFSHVKIKHIDFYKWALWNKILLLLVMIISLMCTVCRNVFLVTMISTKGSLILNSG